MLLVSLWLTVVYTVVWADSRSGGPQSVDFFPTRSPVRDLRAAVVAVGAQGAVHLRGYRRLPHVTVAAVTDLDTERAEKVAAEFGATCYGSYREILDAERIDVLSVCTPPAMHEQIVLEAIASGVKAIHCEKPMAMTPGG